MTIRKRVAILGAGCSGLSVAWGLCDQKDIEVTIIEASSAVGGLSRTIEHNGIRFDIGPHRLSPQLPGIVEKIKELPDIDLMELENEHGVYFDGTVYSYPPGIRDLFNPASLRHTAVFAGGWLCARAGSAARLATGRQEERSFGDIILHYYGRPFSEKVALPMIRKVWGTHDLHEDFARIRFELPTLRTMLRRAVRGRSLPGVRLFYYPRRGFGMIPESIKDKVLSAGHRLELSAHVSNISADTINGPFSLSYEKDDREFGLEADIIVSTISNRALIRYLGDPLAGDIRPFAEAFTSRTMRLGIIVVKNFTLPARVIIFPEEKILFNRLSSFDRFSPELCPEGHAVLMCDVICDEGSRYDIMDDEEFNNALKTALLGLGWFRASDISDCFSLRFPGAYPVLNHERYHAQELIEDFFDSSGIILCGREASSDYNNAHNAIGKGLLVADFIKGKIDAGTLREQARTVGRLPIQD